MKLSTPRWLVRSAARASGRAHAVVRALLTPVSWIWAAVTARRIARTIPGRCGRTGICVGNLTVGGTGKTRWSGPS